MSKFVARLVVGLALLYAGGATAFAYTHYEGAKPDVPTILSDFNGWMGSFFGSRTNAPKPAPAPDAAPAAPGTAAAPEHPAAAGGPPPGATSTPTAVAPPGLDAQGRELWHIQHEVLPKASERARALRNMSRADSAAFEDARVEVMAMLGDARTFLNSILEADADHQQANKLWNRLQEIYTAVKKL